MVPVRAMNLFENARSVDVELDLFSGRPNPRWTLAGHRVDEIRERGRGLAPGESREIPGLGYRGFVLAADRDGDRVRAFEGMIRVERGDLTEILRDDHGLEEWLVAQARDLGFGDVLERFRGGGPRAGGVS
jgi:hypothetical protein